MEAVNGEEALTAAAKQRPDLILMDPYRLWNGENLNGKTIFVHGERGIGDRILFSRYLYRLKEIYPDCDILHVTMPEVQKLMWG
jgi:hypothetical protein